MATSRSGRRLVWIGIPVVLLIALAVLVAVWNWDWFIPMVQARASASVGRAVTIGHLHVRPGRMVTVTADDVVVANPPDWPDGDPPFASIKTLTIQADLFRYLRGGGLVLPLIGLSGPRLFVAETKSGEANFRLSTGGGSTKIGDLRVSDGNARFVVPQLKSDFAATIETQGDGPDAKLVVEAKGTYSSQPINARLVGGALLSLRDANNPWPIDLNIANGPTRVAVQGALHDAMAFKGADVRLRISGPDMSLLEPLVGFPIPKTPPFQLSGKLDLNGFDRIKAEDIKGRLGNSDVAGTIEEQPTGVERNGKSKPVVTLDLRSNRVDLVDLKGFLGGTPARPDTPGATAEQRQDAAKAAASPKVLPDTPASLPRLDWADLHLRYHGAHIQGKDMPMDDLTIVLDMVGGRLALHPVKFGVGKGRFLINADVAPAGGKDLRAKIDLRMQNLDVSRMMAATHQFEGAGTISGVGAIEATGNSTASLLAHGNGEVKMAMAGGDLSAVLVDLTGLHFGNALMSALGMPNKTPVQCFVSDLALQNGVLDFKAMTLDTGEAITNVGGNVDLSKETIDLALKTDAKHFSVGSLPTRLNITGTLKDPKIRPGAEAAVRTGAAAGLAALFAPLALLPTVQFGTSEAEDARCGQLLQQARASAGGKALPPPEREAGR